MIYIVDYGLGNVLAFANIYKRLNIPVSIADTPEKLFDAEKIILPGVGSFDWAMFRLNDSGMRAALDTLVVKERISVLGVCVGLQVMANRSDEGELKGLGWIDADVKQFDEACFTQTARLPHMGWNDVALVKENPLFVGLERDARFYFLHSYYFANKKDGQVLAQTGYSGGLFTSAVHRENVYGVQFHPEKSHHWGVRLLKNFAEFC